jgi:superfamily II DNA or RNA helicase
VEPAFDPTLWSTTASVIGRRVRELSEQNLAAYRVNPLLIDEHANIERATAQGGYGRRQIYELVQNGADALIGHGGGRIQVRLTQGYLYCANQGTPITVAGVDALLSSHLSVKRRDEIGRFGLGFKSVLGVTDRPQFFSRSGSFGFSAVSSAQRIRSIKPDAERVPTLRLATPLDVEGHARADPVLADLMSWATTVVRLPLQPAESGWLPADFSKFPAEFLLFSRHVGSLVLENSVTGEVRRMELTPFGSGARYLLAEGTRDGTWRIFERTHVPTPEAKKDAGELADRESLPVIWAVPIGGRQTRGHFWAFFPTDYQTTLSGIVNAPWKTNEDRLNLLPGMFNEELLDVVARLVIDSLPALVDPQDPGAVLDLMPARGRESPNWADDSLTRRIYDLAATSPSVPNQEGVLVVPRTLQVHPQGAPKAALDVWADCATRPVDWCHPSVETRERRARVDRLVGAGRQATYAEWLEVLVTGRSAESSIAALRVALVAYRELDSVHKQEVLDAHIVLTDAGEFVPPVRGAAFLGVRLGSADVALVDDRVQADLEALAALHEFGVQQVDAIGELEALIARSPQRQALDWDRFWVLARKAESSAVLDVLAQTRLTTDVRVMTLANEFHVLRETLLPGQITPSDGSRDSHVAIDTDYHAVDLALLQMLGASPAPIPGGGSTTEAWFGEYQHNALDQYIRESGALGHRPARDYISFDKRDLIGPLSPLSDLSDEGRLRFTEAVLGAESDFHPWTLTHRTQPDRYPRLSITHPAIWLVQREGRISTTQGPRKVDESVSPKLARWSRFLPVAELSEGAGSALGLPATLGDVGKGVWADAFTAASRVKDANELGSFYAMACLFNRPPDRVWCRNGQEFAQLDPALVVVAVSLAQLETLVTQSVPAILVTEATAAARLVTEWHMRAAESVMRSQVDAIPLTDATPLVDEFPALLQHLPIGRRDIELVRCSELRQETLTEHGKSATEVAFLLDGTRIYWNDAGGDEKLLTTLVSEIGIQLTPADIDDIVGRKADQSRRQLLAKIRKQPDAVSKFLAAVPAEVVRRRLSTALIEATERSHGSLSDLEVGRLAHAVFGVELLHEFRSEMEDQGLQPPQQWAGSRAARLFVRDLGFTKEYAGFEHARRDALLEVDGPPNLPPLHDFQVTITSRIRKLLTSQNGKRGLLSLPTGAGKTRVAVQALTEAVRDGVLDGPILWVAQTDELCEQAVQAWSEVWRSFGPRHPLRLSRLWAANEAEELADGTQVVVATDAKLVGCVGDAQYAWLSKATCLVVDEAHGTVSTAYTQLFSWLGLGRVRAEDRCPLIGLTATPFRGTSEEETKRLVGRYNETRLDLGALEEDQYRQLQEMKVLARVRHELLVGTDIVLTNDEVVLFRQTRLLPSRAEAAVGDDPMRNDNILASIRNLPRDWTILLFAASVEHAETLAALLTLDEIPAAVISAKTDAGARRHYIKEFRAGRLRVLTNYGVLTEGFDAPAVRAVYVARPTFSPNRYQQMIGRGLRGPLNGGKEECLIVNVADNVAQFGEELAFRQFEHLWKASE